MGHRAHHPCPARGGGAAGAVELRGGQGLPGHHLLQPPVRGGGRGGQDRGGCHGQHRGICGCTASRVYLRLSSQGKRRCHTEEGEKAVWSVEYETVRGCEGTVPRLAEVTVECDVGSGEEVESWSVGELEEMEEGKSMLKERKWVFPSPGRRFPAGSSGPAGRRTAAAVTTARVVKLHVKLYKPVGDLHAKMFTTFHNFGSAISTSNLIRLRSSVSLRARIIPPKFKFVLLELRYFGVPNQA